MGFFDKFRRTDNANGKFRKPYYSVQSVHAEGKVLDVCQEGENPGSLIIWDGYGGENQAFTIKQKGPHFYFKSKKDKLYLTVEGPHDGAGVYAAPKSKSENQRFTIDERGDNKFVIYTFYGKCLDVNEGSKDNGAKIIQWEENGGDNQMWTFCDPSDITSSSSEQEEC